MKRLIVLMVGAFLLCACSVDPQEANKLGLNYLNGDGVAQDYAKALKYFSQAAEQGVAEAQNKLGDMYEKGLGINKDYGQALSWYRKAA